MTAPLESGKTPLQKPLQNKVVRNVLHPQELTIDARIIRKCHAIEDDLSRALVREYTMEGNAAARKRIQNRMAIENRLYKGEPRPLDIFRRRVDATQENKFPHNEVAAVTFHDGIHEMRAIFKSRDGEAVYINENGEQLGVRGDAPQRGYMREWLAGVAGKALDFTEVIPATIVRTIEGRVGAVQEWKNGEIAENTAWLNASPEALQMIGVFDYVSANSDRHTENFLVENEPLGNVHAIDHGLAFIIEHAELYLRSFPLRAVQEQELLPQIQEKITQFLSSKIRLKIFEDACAHALGTQDGAKVYEYFCEHLKKLLKGRFPKYTMLDFDERTFEDNRWASSVKERTHVAMESQRTLSHGELEEEEHSLGTARTARATSHTQLGYKKRRSEKK